MTEPKEHQEDREELDLDEETVRDLEPLDSEAEDVQGGRPVQGGRGGECASINCPPIS